MNFTFTEVPSIHRDARSLQYLVDKNQDDALLMQIHQLVLRNIRHYYNNRIDIPSMALNVTNKPIRIAPPMEERNVPVASGIDRGGDASIHLVLPASVFIANNTAIVADGYGQKISIHRFPDLHCKEHCHWHSSEYDTPVSLVLFKECLYVCAKGALLTYKVTVTEDDVKLNEQDLIIHIPQICCICTDYESIYVGTLKPSLILMNTQRFRIEREYPLHPIRYGNRHKKKNRYPWLQDMKAAVNVIVCLFTGSPSPLQLYSQKGEFIRTLITEDKITGAYHFGLYVNPETRIPSIYISDFWDNAVKVFDINGNYIETVCEAGTGLCQTSRPTGIFIEYSGYVTICDMKESYCLQRL